MGIEDLLKEAKKTIDRLVMAATIAIVILGGYATWLSFALEMARDRSLDIARLSAAHSQARFECQRELGKWERGERECVCNDALKP